MEHLFLYYAAPILCGAKPAALIVLRPDCLPAWSERQNALRKATGLRTFEIERPNGFVLLLAYSDVALEGCLRNARASPILARYGYPAECDPGAALERLKERFSHLGFPHEIGIFLGYPPEDVWGFIMNEGRNFLCCRHWKVYHNEEQARVLFRRIDEAHNRAMDILRKPMPIHIVAKLLKAA
jgi:hypothetical protein